MLPLLLFLLFMHTKQKYGIILTGLSQLNWSIAVRGGAEATIIRCRFALRGRKYSLAKHLQIISD